MWVAMGEKGVGQKSIKECYRLRFIMCFSIRFYLSYFYTLCGYFLTDSSYSEYQAVYF